MQIALLAALCVLLIGLPAGGGATASNLTFVAVESALEAPAAEQNFVPVDSAIVTPSVTAPAAVALASSPTTPSIVIQEPLARPVSLVSEIKPLRVLNPQGPLLAFINESTATNRPLSGHPMTVRDIDPRLQRAGRNWVLSKAFHASVGSDPYAMPGIGFPNIETHGPTVQTKYKPYHAVVDWKRIDSAPGHWRPVPAVFCMGLSAQQIAERASKHERQILSYAMEFDISASLIKAVITAESCFDTQAISKVGAEGLMQLMPETARWLKVTDRKDVNQNLSAGIRYLADLRKRFGSEELALAAYNAGPGNVERHGGIPPFQETQQYVVSVMEKYRRYAAVSRFESQRVSY